MKSGSCLLKGEIFLLREGRTMLPRQRALPNENAGGVREGKTKTKDEKEKGKAAGHGRALRGKGAKQREKGKREGEKGKHVCIVRFSADRASSARGKIGKRHARIPSGGRKRWSFLPLRRCIFSFRAVVFLCKNLRKRTIFPLFL